MKNKKSTVLFFLILSLLANSIFAYENTDKIQEKVKEALTKNQEVKNVIKEEVQKQVKEEVKKIKKEILVEKETKKIIQTKEQIFFEKIKAAKNEEERIAILKEFKKEIKDRPAFIDEKIKNIFTNFDLILAKLNQVDGNIQKEKLNLEKQGLKLDLLNKKENQVKIHLDKANTYKATAWIKIEEIDFLSSEKEELAKKIAEVRKNLILSKEEIKKASQILKENIAFIRGALTILKK